MSQLPEDARSAFERARRAYTPSPEQLEQVRVRLAARLADVSSGAGDRTSRDAVHGAPAPSAWQLPGAWFTGSVIVGVLGVALYLGLRSPHAAVPTPNAHRAQGGVGAPPSAAGVAKARYAASEQAKNETPVRAQSAEAKSDLPISRAAAIGAERAVRSAPPSGRLRVRPAAQPEREPPAPISAHPPGKAVVEPAEPEPAEDTHVLARSTSPERPTLSPARVMLGTRPVDGLREEVALLQAARSALEHGELAAADEALAQHRRRFVGGQLRVERVALELWSRCLRGDGPGARARWSELRQLSPAPGLSAMLRERCAKVLP